MVVGITCCVVGHGPSLMGAKKGKKIDSHIVVRLKKGEDLLKYPEDYGTRTDYVCASTEVPGCFLGLPAKEYWGYPKKGYYDETLVHEVGKRLDSKILVPLNLCNTWNAWFRGMGVSHPNVSTGMGAIIIACHRLRPINIYLAGFDTLLDPSIRFDRNSNVPRSGFGPFPNHDWAKENDLLKMLETAYECKIRPLE